jgi:hypothetical protein
VYEHVGLSLYELYVSHFEDFGAPVFVFVALLS